jgi:hypothetical protein
VTDLAEWPQPAPERPRSLLPVRFAAIGLASLVGSALD